MAKIVCSMRMPRTRKAIEQRIKDLGGTMHPKRGKTREIWCLANRFNDIIVREHVRRRGIESLNPNDPADARFLKQHARKGKNG